MGWVNFISVTYSGNVPEGNRVADFIGNVEIHAEIWALGVWGLEILPVFWEVVLGGRVQAFSEERA